MKRLSVICAFLLLFMFKLFAQDMCGTPAITNSENAKKLSMPQKRTANATYTLRVYFHVIRTSNGTGGVSSSNVASAYNRLNNDFNDHGIYFFWDGFIDNIDEDSIYYDVPSTDIYDVRNHIDGIDIYLFPESPAYTYYYPGEANGVGLSSEYYIAGSYNNTPYCMLSTLSHEMGHVLNLWHTHHGTVTEGIPTQIGYDAVQCKELVNGSNSITCGDYVEDTPADPGLNGNVNDNCEYVGYVTDENNQQYNPDVTLIMSYALPFCRNRFSTKQGERMRDAIANLPFLMHTQYQTISGPSIICCSSSGTYSVSNLPSSYTVSWAIDNNDFVLSSSGNQCTVTYTGTLEYAVANLTATIYYYNNLIKQYTKSGIVAGVTDLFAELLITGGDGSHAHWTSNLSGNTVDIEGLFDYPICYSQFEANLYRLSPQTFEPEATPIRHWYSNSLHMVVDNISSGWYLLQVRGINNCGDSDWLEAEIECVETDMLRSNEDDTELAIMYNRQSQMLTVTVNQTPRLTTDNSYTLQLWSETNMVREFRLNDSEIKIPMTGLKNGLYTVRYVNNDKVIAKKFMKF